MSTYQFHDLVLVQPGDVERRPIRQPKEVRLDICPALAFLDVLLGRARLVVVVALEGADTAPPRRRVVPASAGTTPGSCRGVGDADPVGAAGQFRAGKGAAAAVAVGFAADAGRVGDLDCISMVLVFSSWAREGKGGEEEKWGCMRW